MRKALWLLAGVLALACLPACQPAGERNMLLHSAAFADGERIPTRYTCDGEDTSPPLAWEAAPEGTRSFVLIADDPDAPAGRWVHWVVYDLAEDVRALPEGAGLADSPFLQGSNDFGRLSYGGPCPPPGAAHRYFFTLYALDTATLGLPSGVRVSRLEAAMQGHILAQARLMGRYGRR